jgi:hypothetical protein
MMIGNAITGSSDKSKGDRALPSPRSTFANQYESFEDDDIPDVLKPPPDCRGTYMLSQGYRKVSGDYCMGGIDLGPVQTECPKNETSSAEEPPLTGKATTTGSTN